MAFVDITEPKTALAIENLLRPYKRGEKEITPEICREVLRGTNYARSIRDMLACVAEVPEDKQAAFKEVVLSVFHGREQPEDIKAQGKKLALWGGYEEEFSKAKPMLPGHCSEKMQLMSTPARKVCAIVEDREKMDFGGYDKFLFRSNHIDEPRALFLEMCENFPATGDLSDATHITFDNCSIDSLKGYKLPDIDKGNLINFRQKLPQDGDLSMIRRIYLDGVNFKENPVPKFAEGAAIYMRWCKDIPWKALENAEELSLTGCNDSALGAGLLQMKMLRRLTISNCEIDSELLDCQQYSLLDLNNFKFNPLPAIAFRENAVVQFNKTVLPSEADFSNCSQLELEKCNWKAVEKVAFPSYEDYKKYKKDIPWRAEVSYPGKMDGIAGKVWQRLGGR